jgi:hypothetical protein
VCRHRSVIIATRYGLDGPEIESRWGRDFPHTSLTVLGPTQPPIQCVPGVFPGLKRPGRGVNHPPPSSAEVKERAQRYFYSPSGPSWFVLGRTLHFLLPVSQSQCVVDPLLSQLNQIHAYRSLRPILMLSSILV